MSDKLMLQKKNSGFTLLELIISLTILSVIVVIIFGAFRIGVRAWEKGEKDVEIQQRHRIVLNLIKDQIASICLRSIKNGKQAFVFKGYDKSLEFLSYVSLNPENRYGIVYVKYVVTSEEEEKEQLSFFEKNIILTGKEFDTEELLEEDFYVLIPEAEHITFEYLKGETEEKDFEWQESWDPENDKGFPLAVKMILKKDPESAPMTVIARIEQN